MFEGSFAEFGRPKTRYSYKGDPALAMQILKECRFANVMASQISENLLDHGLMVPLHYLNAEKKPILPVAVVFRPLKELFGFGQLLAKVCADSGKKVAVVASADMSHRLTQDAPAGFHPRGKEFDDQLVALVKQNDVEGILNFDPELAEIEISVDVLIEPEPVQNKSELDAKRYGIVVKAGARRGLLLPDLPGVETPEHQIEICRLKGGIGADEPVELFRFEVKRYY
jgi:hypothetical protein